MNYGQTQIPLTVIVPPSFTAHRSLYREIPITDYFDVPLPSIHSYKLW